MVYADVDTLPSTRCRHFADARRCRLLRRASDVTLFSAVSAAYA